MIEWYKAKDSMKLPKRAKIKIKFALVSTILGKALQVWVGVVYGSSPALW